MKEPSAERKYTGLQSTVLVKAATCVAVAAPVYSDIAYQCDDKGDEDALSYGDVAC